MNKYNSRKLNHFNFKKCELKINPIKINKDGSFEKFNEYQRYKDYTLKNNSSKLKSPLKKNLMIPLVITKGQFNSEIDNRRTSEDILLINLEENFLKIGVINQMEDFYFAKINTIDNSLSMINDIYYDNYTLEDKGKFSKMITKSQNENPLFKFSLDLINTMNNINDFEMPVKKKKLMLVTLENEKNIRILKIQNCFLELLMKFNIWQNLENRSLRNSEISNLIKGPTNLGVKDERNDSFIIPKNDRNGFVEENQLISQIFITNFSNVPAIHLKAIFTENHINLDKSKINIITSLVDNSIKYFEMVLDSNILSEFETSILTLKYSINAHIAKIQDIIFLSELNIASLSYDQSLKIWDINKCKLINIPILNNNNQKIFSKLNTEIEKNNKICQISSDSLSEKKNLNKIFPVFTKILNDAIFSQSYASCNEFVKCYTDFYEKLKYKMKEWKNIEDDNISVLDMEQIFANFYTEFLPILNESSNCLLNKKNLDYLIFTFSELNWINKKSTYFLIKYEFVNNFNDDAKINAKNLQSFFALIFYLFIFSSKEDLDDISKIILKIKIKIQKANWDFDKKQKLDRENNFIFQNENTKKFSSNSLMKIESIIKFYNHYMGISQNDMTSNIDQIRLKNLLELNIFVFNDIPLRAKFFELLINKKYHEADAILEDNDLFFENLLLTKLIDSDVSYNIFKSNENFCRFIEKLNKFRTFIYSKQIYQAQKCQSVLNILQDIHN